MELKPMGWSDDELATMEGLSYEAPPEKEFGQSNFKALGTVMNSGFSMYRQGQIYNKPEDDSSYKDIPYSKDASEKLLKEKGYSPSTLLDMRRSPSQGFDSDFKRAEYVDTLEKSHAQVADQFSTAGMLAAGIPLAILDIDLALINPSIKIANTVRKGLNLSSTMAKVAAASATGALIAAESNAVMEATTGVYRDGSAIESAAVGAALGGTLGLLTNLGKKQSDLDLTTDTKNTPLSKEEAHVEQTATAKQALKDIEETIAAVNRVKGEQSQVAKELSEAKSADRTAAIAEAKLEKAEVGRAKDKAKEDLRESRVLGKEAVTEIKALRVARAEAVGIVNKSKTLLDKAVKLKAAVKLLKPKLAPLQRKIVTVEKKLEALKDTVTVKGKAQVVKLTAQLKKQQDSLARLEASVALKNKTIAEAALITPVVVRQQKVAVSTAFKQEREGMKWIDEVAKDTADKKAVHSKAVAAFRDFKVSTTKAKVTDSTEAAELRELLAAYGADLSPEGIKTIMRKKASLQDDIASMEAGDFNLKHLYGIKKVKKNYVEKLNKELEEIDTIKDFKQTAAFKKVNPLVQKFLISPIEHNLNSLNDWVSGFSSMLHSGTIYHGKINSRTAWIIREEHDKALSRMHAAITHSYGEAVAAGYKGKLVEFESEVAVHHNGVIGRMQRDYYSGIEGGLKDMELFKAVSAKEGGITRKHSTDNKWIQKATDDILDYYESIHAKGKGLKLEAFKNSLGKGYNNRVYSRAGIEAVGGRDNAIALLVRAQENFADATIAATKEEKAVFLAKATTAIDSTLSREYKMRQITKDIGIPRQGTTSALKQRGIMAFDDELIDILDTDIRANSHIYALNTHGRLALKEKLGVDNDEQLKKMIDQLGATPRELDNIRAMIETIKGTREVSSNPFDPFTQAMKMASSYTSVMHSMGFGITTLTEISSLAKEFGWSKTIDTLVGTPKEIYSLYKYGTPSEKNSIELMNSYGNATYNTKVNRLDGEGGLDTISRTQEILDDIVKKESIWSGLLPVTDMLRMASAVLSVDFMAGLSVAKRVSKTDLKRLEDMGFGLEDLARIRDTLKVDATGRIGNMDRKTWGALDQEITNGVMTMTERTILSPNGMTLPLFMTNMNEGAFVPRILLKFMRFPFESYERMLVRGVQEADAKQLIALGGNIGMWTAILAAKDAIKDEDKQQFSGSDGTAKLMTTSLMMNSVTAFPLAMIDNATGIATGKQILSGYRYGGGAVIGDARKLQQGKPKFTIPGANIDIGEAFSKALDVVSNLEILNKP